MLVPTELLVFGKPSVGNAEQNIFAQELLHIYDSFLTLLLVLDQYVGSVVCSWQGPFYKTCSCVDLQVLSS